MKKTLLPSLISIFAKLYSWNTIRNHLQNCHQRRRTKFE